MKTKLTDQNKIDIVKLFKEGLSMRNLGKMFSVSHVAISGILKRRGIKK